MPSRPGGMAAPSAAGLARDDSDANFAGLNGAGPYLWYY